MSGRAQRAGRTMHHRGGLSSTRTSAVTSKPCDASSAALRSVVASRNAACPTASTWRKVWARSPPPMPWPWAAGPHTDGREVPVRLARVVPGEGGAESLLTLHLAADGLDVRLAVLGQERLAVLARGARGLPQRRSPSIVHHAGSVREVEMLGEEGGHRNEQGRPVGIVGEHPRHDRVVGEGLHEHPGDEIAIVGCRRPRSAHPNSFSEPRRQRRRSPGPHPRSSRSSRVRSPGPPHRSRALASKP